MTEEERYRRAHCGSKVDHKTQSNAKKVARAMTSRFKKRIDPYKCQFCGGWHVGHRIQKVIKYT